VLINGAGAARGGTFASLSDADWVESLDAKFFATIRVLRAIVPAMRRSGGGRIINIVGYGGQQPPAWGLAASAANAALMNVTRALAAEVAADGILVNAINPGLIETPRLVGAIAAIADREGITPEVVRARFCAEIPLKRIGGPREVAGLAAFLASSHASYITGATFLVDGGATRGI
jgi:3-oxoacyl-[acyl-carrier protein] reductase